MTKREPPWKHPPPPGTVWATIDEERRKLGWSRRKLSEEADLSSTHYNMLGTRGDWGQAKGDTQAKLILALVEKGGVSPSLFSSQAAPQAPAVTADTIAMLEKAARAYARIVGVSDDEAWLRARGVRPAELTVEGFLEAMLTALQSSEQERSHQSPVTPLRPAKGRRRPPSQPPAPAR